MIKNYNQFIKESFGGFRTMGEYIESLSKDNDYALNIISQYTQDIDPTVRIANVINLLPKSTQELILKLIKDEKTGREEPKEADVILQQALALQEAGCSALLLEAMPKEPAEMIAKQLSIPVYGIGGGDGVDGQLVIFHDLTGLFWEFKSKFVKRYCEAGKIIQDALEQYVDEVKSGAFPSQENFYEIKEDELEKLLGDDKWKYEKDRVENNAVPNHSVTPITSKPSEIKR